MRWSPSSATGRLDNGPYTYVWMDALTQKVREGGRIINVAVVTATGVNAEGHREILGVDVITTEDGAGWLAFLRGLVARGLSGVALVISDAHPGLVDAIASTLVGATLAAVPHALHAEPVDPGPEVRAGDGRDARADDLRAARRGRRSGRNTPASSNNSTNGSVTRPRISPTPLPTCSRSPRSRKSTGGRSGRTTPKSD